MLPATETPVYHARSGRVVYFDNTKLTLMACVVVGHLLKTGGALHRHYARALFVLIYSFHMPLFVFVSGLFLNRRTMERERVLHHAVEFFGWGMVAKLLRAGSSWIWGKGFDFSLVEESGLPWFMFALSAFYVAAWLLRRVDATVVMGVSVVLSLVAGYVGAIGDAFCLSRILVFFPFFWLGHMLRPSDVRRSFALTPVRCVCAVVLVGCLALCCWKTRSFYVLRRLFFGRFCYADTHIENCTALHRLGTYAISALVGTAVLGLVPHGRIPFVTEAGRRTLQVYLLHLEIVDALRRLHVCRALVHVGRWGWLFLVPLGIALTLVLAAPKLPHIRRGGPAGSAEGQG